MNPTGAVFGYWSDGVDQKFLLRTNPNDFSKPIWRLPSASESLLDIDEPLTRDKLVPAKDLYGVFKDIEQEILAHQSLDTFNEIFKIVFAKLFDERVNLHNATAPAKFKMGLTEGAASVAKATHDLFEKAKNKWKDVYRPGDKIELNDVNISYCVQALQQYHLIRSGDVLGTAFELLVNQEMKGDMGQYFTPRQVVDMMVRMLSPALNERVCDPACGSGGFLIYSMRCVFSLIEKKWDDPDDRAEQRKDYAQESLTGMDNDQRLVRVAKAYMIMENDGRSGIYSADSLDYDTWEIELRKAIVGRNVPKSDLKPGILVDNRLPTDGVEIILTNPPFAGAIKVATTLRQYQLALDEKGKMRSELDRAKLFLERCIDLLKPGGRMGIVLPQGLLNNISDQSVREFTGERCRILAVIGLHPYTFNPPRGRVKPGDLLLACTAHEIFYVGRKVDYVREVPENIVGNNVCVADILIFRPRLEKPTAIMESYVAAFLRSPWGLHQVQRCIRGLRGGHVYDIDLERYVRVPLPDAKWMEDFESLSNQAESLRNTAKHQIVEAVAQVDTWIEATIAV